MPTVPPAARARLRPMSGRRRAGARQRVPRLPRPSHRLRRAAHRPRRRRARTGAIWPAPRADRDRRAPGARAAAPRLRSRGTWAGYRLAMPPVAILDVDGTLVETNYHHAIAWYRAFTQYGVELPVWRIHRAIGMGGDQLVGALAGDEVEEEKGDDIRAAEKALYMAMIHEVRPLPSARKLLETLKDRGHTVVLASSAKQDEIDHYLDLLDARELADDWTSSADVERTKPNPDLVQTALEKAGGGDAVMIGDSVWDVEDAKRAGIPTIAVRTGGFGHDELVEAGAANVFESIDELLDS